MITRDWKGQYAKSHLKEVKGWHLFGSEDEIETGQDSYCTIYCDTFPNIQEHSPQTIFDVIEAIECGEDVNGFEYEDQYTVKFVKVDRRKTRQSDKPTEGNKTSWHYI